DAILNYDKAIKANSKNSDAFYNKSYMLLVKGDTLKAIANLKKALAIETKNEYVDLLEKLKAKN
ncbi:MAG: tetratricopeptide repeat protein, partial [Bacteroidota bacterium]